MNFFSVESAEIGDDMKPTVGLLFSYQHRPFVILNCQGETCGDDVGTGGEVQTINVVENFMVADLMGSFNFLKRFQVGLALPLILWQHGDKWDITQQGVPPNHSEWMTKSGEYTAGGVLSDLRIHLKVRILGQERKDGFSLGAAVIPSLPLAEWAGYSKGFAGNPFIGVTAPKILAGYRVGPFRSAINVGAFWTKSSELFSVQTGSALTYGGAVGYSVIPEIELLAEIYGRKMLLVDNFTDMETAPLLFLGGGRFTAGDFVFSVSGGGGILSGVGVPQFQVIGGAMWAPRAEEKPEDFMITEWDIDGDGVDNDADGCPEMPEDLDSFQDEDGCPDNDNDDDGVVDGYDSCPNEPEDKDNFRDDDGCPDLDHDEDGIKGDDDKCPDRAEDYDEYEDEDGCPEDDNDKDGFADADDACPNLAEDKDEYQDDDGCPDLDNDNDGVPDVDDKCPDKPETLNGIKDDDGCPDKGKALVVVTEDKIEIKQQINFETNSDKITGDKSFEILDIVGKILVGNTAIRVSIEGHTDNRGKADYNRDLSKRRSEAVKTYLGGKGVAADRLETVGWGPDQPIDSNKTKKGRAANRRVEFVIIRPEKPAVPEETGEAAEGSGEDMDFTSDTGGGGGGDDSMDFTIEEDTSKDKEVDAPPDEEGEMDFTAEE